MDIAVRLTGTGGIDQLAIIDQNLATPGPGEIRLRHEAIGVNFIDIYHRTGLYPLPSLPAVLGVEGAGIVEAVGAGVTTLSPGDRVAYAGAPVGGYATTRLLPEARAIRLPDGISTRLAAASMLRGLTAHMLLTRAVTVTAGKTILVHAAAGGLGTLLTRWAKHLGAEVIGTVSNAAKADAARESGTDHIIVGRDADLVGEVARLTGGRGVDVAYDGIGGDMLARTLQCVRRFGTIASIGQAAGPIPPVPVELLGPQRALSLARPSVMAYAADLESYGLAAADLLAVMTQGVSAHVGGEYGLSEAGRAHADLEAGRTSGSLLLMP